MAWALDAVASDFSIAAAATKTVSHALGTDDPTRIVLAVVGGRRNVTGVTYNGVAMTAVANPASGTNEVRIYRMLHASLPAFAGGPFDCIVTWDGNQGGGNAGHIHVLSFTSLLQQAEENAAGQNYASGTSISDSVTPTTGDALILSGLTIEDDRTITPTSGQTQRTATNAGAGNTPRHFRVYTDTGPTTPGADATTYTLSSASVAGHHVAAFGISTTDTYSGRGIGRGIGRGVMR